MFTQFIRLHFEFFRRRKVLMWRIIYCRGIQRLVGGGGVGGRAVIGRVDLTVRSIHRTTITWNVIAESQMGNSFSTY